MAGHGLPAGRGAVEVFLGCTANLPIDRNDVGVERKEREVFRPHSPGRIENDFFRAERFGPCRLQAPSELRIVNRWRYTFFRHDNFRQLVFRQPCNSPHVLCDAFDAVKKNLLCFGTCIANRELQVRAIRDDIVFCARVKRADRDNTRHARRELS